MKLVELRSGFLIVVFLLIYELVGCFYIIVKFIKKRILIKGSTLRDTALGLYSLD